MELSTTHDKQFEEVLEDFIKTIKSIKNFYNSQLNTLPKELKYILCDKDYKERFAAFENSKGVVLNHKDIVNFQNKYLREKHLLNCDEIKARSLKGKKITIKKDDFNHAFLSNNWGGLDFSQRYTILHWLQSTLSTNHKPLPPIDFILPYTTNSAGSYNYRTNSLYLNFSNLNLGIYMAGNLIHEMDHFNGLNKPDINDYVQINNKEVSLKNYLISKYRQIDAIDIDLFQVNKADWNSVLFLKNILSPIGTTKTHNTDVNSTTSFKQYMQNELYYFSPIERRAFTEESRKLTSMMTHQPMKYLDRAVLDEIKKHADKIQLLKYSPVLKELNDTNKYNLLDTVFQVNYYNSNSDLYMSQKCVKYEYEADAMYIGIYNHFKDKNGKLSLGR